MIEKNVPEGYELSVEQPKEALDAKAADDIYMSSENSLIAMRKLMKHAKESEMTKHQIIEVLEASIFMVECPDLVKGYILNG